MTGGNPFPGLRSFEPEEDYLFFGREHEIDELLRRLRRHRLVAVVGTSGSGKSSLVRSGAIPSLYSGFMVQAGSSWRVAVLRPGEDPVGSLASALSDPEVLGDGGDLAEIQRAFLETTLRASSRGLADAVRQARLPADENLLVVVDQFEELFRFKETGTPVGPGTPGDRGRRAADEAVGFVKLLLEGARQDLPIYLVITMRSDFIGHCMEFAGLPEAINEGLYLIPRMSRDEMRSAITGPVAVGGGEITPRLVLRLLNDVGDDPDQLPILQHALMRTWDHWRSVMAEGPLDLEHYAAVGTLREALSRHAEEAYGELEDDRQRRIAERLFKALTDGGDGGGVRRPCRLREIADLTDASLEELIEVVERFRLPGRSFLMPPAGTPLAVSSIVDLSHESLMRLWQRLARWTQEEARAALFYLRLARAAERYEEGAGGLWRAQELELARAWREENRPNEMWAGRYPADWRRSIAYLDRSQRARDDYLARQEKARRGRWRRLQALAAVLALAVGALAFQSHRIGAEAERANREAEAARQVSDFMVGLFEVSDPGRSQGKNVTAREVLEEGAEKVARELATQPLVQARLLNAIGTVYHRLGLYGEAEPLLERSQLARQSLLPAGHLDAAESDLGLGRLYSAQGRYAAAERLLEGALSVREEALGGLHPGVADVVHELAQVHQSKGELERAEELFRRALAIRESVLGRFHPDLAKSCDALATLLVGNGRYGEGEELLRRALEIREQTLGEDHLEIASSLTSLAFPHFRQGQHAEAEPLLVRALAIQEKILGPEHSAVAVALNNLATVYDGQDRYGDSEPLLRRAVAVFEQALGPEHPDTLGAVHNLAWNLYQQERYDEAEAAHLRALEGRRKVLGEEHPKVAISLNNLALLYRARGRYPESEALFEQALGLREKVFGPDHPDVAVTLVDYAGLLRLRGEEERAAEMAARGAAIRAALQP